MRIGLEPEHLLTSHGANGMLALGRRPRTDVIQAAWIQPDGSTTHGATLPASFGTDGYAAAVVDRGVRDPDLVAYVAGRSEVVAVTGTSHDRSFGGDGVVDLGTTMSPAAVAATWGTGGVPDVFVLGVPDDGRGLRLVHIHGSEVTSNVRIDDPLDAPLAVERMFVEGEHLFLAGTYGRPTPQREGPADTDVAILKVDLAGNPVRSFGDDGLVRVSTNRTDVVSDVVRRPDGRFVLAGFTFSDDGRASLQLVGITADGRLDGSFGLYARSIGEEVFAGSAPALVQYAGGFLLATSQDSQVITRRTDPDGVFDGGWGVEGRQVNDVAGGAVTTDIGFTHLACLHRACNTDDGRFVVAARTVGEPGGALVGLRP